MTAICSNKILMGLLVTIPLVYLVWVYCAVGMGAPTVAVKHMIDDVIKLVTDKQLKTPEQASYRWDLLEETIGKSFDFEEMAKRSLATHWKS